LKLDVIDMGHSQDRGAGRLPQNLGCALIFHGRELALSILRRPTYTVYSY